MAIAPVVLFDDRYVKIVDLNGLIDARVNAALLANELSGEIQPVDGTTNEAGDATTASRADHKHAHGVFATGDRHTDLLDLAATRALTGKLTVVDPDAVGEGSINLPPGSAAAPADGDFWYNGSNLEYQRGLVEETLEVRSSKSVASGYAGLNASTKVIEDPANATATPTVSKVVISSALGRLEEWLSHHRQVGTTPIESWYVCGQLVAGALSAATPSVNTLYAFPLWFPRDGTIDRIAFNVTVGAAKGGVARVGIYTATSNSNLYPSALVVDGGEIITTTTGVKTSTISVAMNSDLLHWLVMLMGTAAAEVRAVQGAECLATFMLDSALGTSPGYGISVTQAYGALPNPFTTGGARWTTGVAPAIFVRFNA